MIFIFIIDVVVILVALDVVHLYFDAQQGINSLEFFLKISVGGKVKFGSVEGRAVVTPQASSIQAELVAMLKFTEKIAHCQET